MKPSAIALLVDYSGSMGGNCTSKHLEEEIRGLNKLDLLRFIVATLVQSLAPKTTVKIVTYASSVQTLFDGTAGEFVERFSSGRALHDAVGPPNGRTALSLALTNLERICPTGEPYLAINFTDGQFNHKPESVPVQITQFVAARPGSAFLHVGYGADIKADTLSSLPHSSFMYHHDITMSSNVLAAIMYFIRVRSSIVSAAANAGSVASAASADAPPPYSELPPPGNIADRQLSLEIAGLVKLMAATPVYKSREGLLNDLAALCFKARSTSQLANDVYPLVAEKRSPIGTAPDGSPTFDDGNVPDDQGQLRIACMVKHYGVWGEHYLYAFASGLEGLFPPNFKDAPFVSWMPSATRTDSILADVLSDAKKRITAGSDFLLPTSFERRAPSPAAATPFAFLSRKSGRGPSRSHYVAPNAAPSAAPSAAPRAAPSAGFMRSLADTSGSCICASATVVLAHPGDGTGEPLSTLPGGGKLRCRFSDGLCRVDQLRVGDVIVAHDGHRARERRTVVAIARSLDPCARRVFGPQAGSPVVTEWHPVLVDGQWQHAGQVAKWSESAQTSHVYSIAVVGGWHPVLACGDAEVIAAGLGHQSDDPVLAHAYFGSRQCVVDVVNHSVLRRSNGSCHAGIATIFRCERGDDERVARWVMGPPVGLPGGYITATPRF